MKIFTLHFQFSKSFPLLLLAFIFGYIPLIAQNQYWQLTIGEGFLFNPDASGIIVSNDNSSRVYDGKIQREISPFGKILGETFTPSINSLTSIFFQDDREDIWVRATKNGFNNEINLLVFKKDAPAFPNIIDLEANFGEGISNIYKPVCVKIDANDYLLVDQEKVFHVKIIDFDNYQLNYSLAHNSEQITGGTAKDGVAYLCSANGDILRYDGQGELTKWSVPGISPFEIIATDDGFALTGEENGQSKLVKINNSGSVEWEKSYSGKRGYSLIQTVAKNYVITGATNFDAGFVLKTDAEGNELWQTEVANVPGIQVAENRFGAIYVLSRGLDEAGESYFAKISPDGETGPVIQQYESYPLQVNNVEASVSPLGQLFFDGNDSQYFFPAGSNIATIFAADLWIGGADSQGNLHLSARQYTGDQNYQMGPLNADPKFFQRIWSVSQAEIDLVHEDLQDGIQNVDWPLDILQWPAKGNTLVSVDGDAFLIEENLAPYIDKNNDGIYNPADGDFPFIKGEQMLWWVFNDDGPGTVTDADKVGVEIKASLYANGCNPDHISDNTTFLDYEITNKSTENYPDLSLGFWSDPDLGCYTDDFIGSLPTHNAAYVYNEDFIDGSDGAICPQGVNTYATEVPIQAMVFLNQPLNSFTYMMNPSVGNPTPGTGDPYSASSYINLINGKWSDGTPLTSGGIGYNPGSTDYTMHAFSGEPSNSDEWSLCSIPPYLSDRRMVMGTNFENFGPGDVVELNMAFVTSEGAALPCPSLNILKGDIEEIQSVYDNSGAAYILDLDQYSVIGENSATLDAGAGAASYLWSTGESEQSIEVTAMQDYSVTVTDFFGCEHIDQITVDFTSGVGDPLAATTISLHPNPANDFIYIQAADSRAIESLTIYSLEGKLIKRIKGAAGNNQIAVEDLPAGMYLVNVQMLGGFATERFVKN